jgi:hypothetical protein
MPLIFDSVFAAALARELDARWSGRRLEGVRFDREARSVAIHLGDETWIWLLHPREGVLMPLPRFAAKVRDRGLLPGPRRITGVSSPADTRQIVLALAGPEEREELLIFDLVTNRWNALHVEGDEVRAVLNVGLGRDPVAPGDPWRPAISDRRWAEEAAPGLEAWISILRELSDPDAGSARRRIAWLSGSNEDAVLEDALTGVEVDTAAAAESLARYRRLRDAALRAPPEGWLLHEPDGDARPYVASLDRGDAERVGSVLDLFAVWARRSDRIEAALRAASETPDTTALREALAERRERTSSKIRALRAEVEESPRDPEELRQLGHLLLARKADVPAGVRDVRLENFSGELVTVELDPALDAVGNAEAYYERAKRQERAAGQLPVRIAKARRRLTALDAALDRLATRGPDDSLWKLAGGKRSVLAPDGSRRGGPAERLPYRVYRTSSGREIRAGRSAKGNDELTFRHSAPEDIWMHVREAPGSHVILRWGRKEQNPPEADIAEAALVAAVLSRARGSNVVPVAWTRRKYVRKPRKAPPGTVAPERTQTVFVEPDARRVSKMAETD